MAGAHCQNWCSIKTDYHEGDLYLTSQLLQVQSNGNGSKFMAGSILNET